MSVHHCFLRGFCLLIGGAVLAPVATRAHDQLIVNGGFETGDLTGWAVVNFELGDGTGGWTINDGTFVPTPAAGTTPPICGDYDAVSGQTGPGLRLLISSPITLPATVSEAWLSWTDRIRNLEPTGTFLDPNQEFRVLLTDVNGDTLAELFSTNPGDNPIQYGPNRRCFDVTALLQSLAGQTVHLVFAQQDELLDLVVNVDNVSLRVEDEADDDQDDEDEDEDDDEDEAEDEDECEMEIELDIQPGSSDNTVCLKPVAGTTAAVLPVAVLSNPWFDARNVDPLSLVLCDPSLSGVAVPCECHEEDVDSDGDTDLVVEFEVRSLVAGKAIGQKTRSLELAGATTHGLAIAGADRVKVTKTAARKGGKSSTGRTKKTKK